MKKLKKINLELNKEIISELTNDNLIQLKGGTILTTPQSVNGCLQSRDNPCKDTYQATCASRICPIYSQYCDANTEVSECACLAPTIVLIGGGGC